MLTLVVALAGVSVWVEWQIVHSNIPILSKLMRWFFANKGRAIIGSIMLSAFIGSKFEAGGLICLIGGLGSTYLIQPLYAAEKAGLIEDGHRKVDASKSYIVDHADDIRHRAHQVKTVTVFTAKVVYAPFKASFWLLDKAGVK